MCVNITKNKNGQINKRWGPVYIFLCVISSFLTVVLSFRDLLAKTSIEGIRSTWFDFVYALLFGSNLGLLITLLPIALYDEYDCTFLGYCRNNHIKKQHTRYTLGEKSELGCCSTRDEKIFWIGMTTLLWISFVLYIYYALLVDYAIWLLFLAIPFTVSWFYVILQSRFFFVVMGYVIFVMTMILIFHFNSISFVAIFWSEMYLIIVPTISVFLLGRKRHLRQMGITICVVIVSVMDLVTDVNVIAVWFIAGDYWWAIMQLTFNLSSQILSALYIREVKGWKQKSMYDESTGEKERRVVWTERNGFCHQLVILLGIGRAFYGIKSFKNLDEENELLNREYYLLKLWVNFFFIFLFFFYICNVCNMFDKGSDL
ncbi:hypothetical protein RFI_21003 [Reticulomyxa filosa]|uniref:Uncharacterized protein n=1 Tax=Reticulomyxa filosa TaxID=46433 RepID=X6MQS4_RETFI|nr:hypothetical protein RFI_21003 [Reticulomyxa filosa]|eukprot:ETO16348.1 hypothetical protein RFI_21003 [Reticulomyxa filosa]